MEGSILKCSQVLTYRNTPRYEIAVFLKNDSDEHTFLYVINDYNRDNSYYYQYIEMFTGYEV